jgi:hypothetical protein
MSTMKRWSYSTSTRQSSTEDSRGENKRDCKEVVWLSKCLK